MKEKMYYEQLGYDFDPPFYSSASTPIITNYDCLISKTPEELAEFIAKVQRAGSYGRAGAVFDYIDLAPDMVTLWLDWLRQEANNGETK